MSIVNPPKKYDNAYPISTFTYVIVPLQSSKATDLKHLLFWAVTKGQTGPYTAKLRFVPLPKSVLVVAEKAIAKIHELGRVSAADASAERPAAPSPGAAGPSATSCCSSSRAPRRSARLSSSASSSGSSSTGHTSRSRSTASALSRESPGIPSSASELYGAGSFLFGTVITSFFAILVATPIAIGIALFLTELLHPQCGPVTALVETLAAVPSVILGLWGILVLGPALRTHVEPWLHSGLGWIPLFGAPSSAGASILTAIVVLTIMVLPIVSSISRELFLSVPPELKEGALALGTTRWEMVRGVMFPYARGPESPQRSSSALVAQWARRSRSRR